MTCKENELLIYFLVDCSNAMSGKLLEKARAWIKYFRDDYSNDPTSLECTRFSIITFDSLARQVVPPTKLMDFQVPRLQTNGNSAVLGEALRLLKDCINRDVGYGGWKPIVYLFCKSMPTDKEIFFNELSDIRDFTDEHHIFAYYEEPDGDYCGELAYILNNITGNLSFINRTTPGVYLDPEGNFDLPWTTRPLDSPWSIITPYKERRPIYLLIDCSSSMSGKPIDTVKQGIQDFVSELKSDPISIENAFLSVITFDSVARQVISLTALLDFQIPQLQTGGSSNLTEAFRVLKGCVIRDTTNRDWRPLVFVFTVGSHTNQKIFEFEVNKLDKPVFLQKSIPDAQRSIVVIAFAVESYNKIDPLFLSDCVFSELVNREEGDLYTDYGADSTFIFGNKTLAFNAKKEDSRVNLPVSLNKNLNSKGEVSMESYVRRLPVYLLLDCSGSMSGEPIEAVRQGINTLLSDLKSDPQALETAYLSVITFDSNAQQVVPLTELMSFNTPELHASGLTSMGGALRVLKDCIQRELLPNTEEHKGDWKPLVFLLTDGNPTDGEVLRSELQDMSSLHAANIVACAAGPYADTVVLKQITPNVLMMNSTSAGDMAAFFAWVSSSIGISSKSVSEKPGETFTLPPPPQGFTVVP